MDAPRFDALARSLTVGSRRGALGGLLLGSALGLVRLTPGEAKKRKKRKKKAPTCVPQCGGKTCGDDGCGGTCGTCPVCQQCASGICEDLEMDTRCPVRVCTEGVCSCSIGSCDTTCCPSRKARCLANSTCIRTCRPTPCPSYCTCLLSTEGQVCAQVVPGNITCQELSPCDDSSDCPKGKFCMALDGQTASGCGYPKGCQYACSFA